MGEWAAPFRAFRTAVREEWLDYNGHMHDAFYATALSDANELLFEALDLSRGYREVEGKAYYTVETHIRFVAECSRGDVLTAETTLVEADARRIRLYTELAIEGGGPVANGDSLYLHVDPDVGRTVPLAPDRETRLREVFDAHAGLPRPPHLGLGVGTRPNSHPPSRQA
jgi:acyl-CoA thioesterase FadM